MKMFLIPLLCLLSFAAGYWFRSAAVNQTPAMTDKASPFRADRAPSDTATPVVQDRMEVLKRSSLTPLEVYQEYKRKNYSFKMSMVNPGGDVSMQAALILGLSVGERTQIEKTVAEAKNAIDMKRAALASARTSDDGLMMTITVPSIAAEGTQIYESALSQIRSVLGEDRFFLFSETCGDYFDGSFDHFGGDDVTYEVSADTDLRASGPKTCRIKRRTVEPDPRRMGAIGEGSWTTPLSEVKDPVLRRFLFPE